MSFKAMNFRGFTAICFVLLHFTGNARAATLAGKIIDQTNQQPVSGVTIWLENTIFSAESDSNGNYNIDNIPDGIFTIIVGGKNYQQKVYHHFGIGSYAGTHQIKETSLPSEFSIDQNFPNPFNPETRISFSLPGNGPVQIQIFDSLGRHVRWLVRDHLSAGNHTVSWNATNDLSRKVASGIYYLRLHSGKWQKMIKMAVIE